MSRYDFIYFGKPTIPASLMSPSGFAITIDALIDTGADVSLFDSRFADELDISMDGLPRIAISGVGGLVREANLAEVTLRLLGHPDLELRLEVAFAPDVELLHGNLIGLDVLEHFDFALAHADRLGYLGRR